MVRTWKTAAVAEESLVVEGSWASFYNAALEPVCGDDSVCAKCGNTRYSQIDTENDDRIALQSQYLDCVLQTKANDIHEFAVVEMRGGCCASPPSETVSAGSSWSMSELARRAAGIPEAGWIEFHSKKCVQVVKTVPVSYTHLTLPTKA